MLFNYPSIIGNIKEIKTIYDINEKQEIQIDKAISTAEGNLYIDTSDKTYVERWEKVLNLKAYDSDTIQDRRFRIKSKINERLPYSYKALINRLNSLCDYNGYELNVDIDNQSIMCLVNLSNKGKLSDFKSIIDEMVPVNMTIQVELLKNRNDRLSGFTHEELSRYTHTDLEEETLRHER